jgi:hypothetical protein
LDDDDDADGGGSSSSDYDNDDSIYETLAQDKSRIWLFE